MFNKETEYALRSLVYIQVQNFKGRKPGVDEISCETAAPRFFVAKILHRMVKAGYLGSIKGKGGGFFFDAGKPSVPVRDLIISIEGDRTITGCIFGLSNCDAANPCPMHQQYAPIRDSIENLLTSETINSLALKYTWSVKDAPGKINPVIINN